jgi:hypothetical protein
MALSSRGVPSYNFFRVFILKSVSSLSDLVTYRDQKLYRAEFKMKVKNRPKLPAFMVHKKIIKLIKYS